MGRIAACLHRTPVITSRPFNAWTGASLLRCGNFRRGGSFKLRGAMNAMLAWTRRHGRVALVLTLRQSLLGFAYAAHRRGVMIWEHNPVTSRERYPTAGGWPAATNQKTDVSCGKLLPQLANVEIDYC